jgi:tetratricopeptide (TPR) repeat protein
VASADRQSSRPVFISYASGDRKQALRVCDGLERRGVGCWIASRDVAPGENYQEAIVRAIRGARAMVLVFSPAANESDEIKKELSLASRYRTPVMALRIQDVEPSDAFAYELSTRQWIEATSGWEKPIDSLARRIAELPGSDEEPLPRPMARAGGPARVSRRAMTAIAACLLLAIAAGAWWLMRTVPPIAHGMTVRMAGFRTLSADLPASMRETVDAEISAAFNADGVVGVSTAPAPAPGTAPAYALGGTNRRDGETIRVITRLTNERSGTTLWTNQFNYDGKEVANVPRHIAVDAGNVVRCGLFGASTYRKPLPDPILRDYMQFCQGHWDPNLAEGRKALIPAQRVVAAVPDFSWGWAAVAGAYWKVALTSDDDRLADEARATGRQAADRAIAIDSKNSEALYIKSMLVDRHDWLARDTLLTRAVAARRLDCGCERHQYGWMLANVGRLAEGVEQLRLANDMLALYVYTPLTLADALVAAGKPEEAKTYYDAAISLAPDSGFAEWIAMQKASYTGDIKLLADPKLPLAANLRGALLKGYRALDSGDARARAQAVAGLLALPKDQQTEAVALLLAKLGAKDGAFQIAARMATTHEYPGPSLFWYQSMRATLDDPRFPAIANQVGLMKYWKTKRAKPDVCTGASAPPFCRMI